jgi:uncharacterized protein DUF5670
VREGSETDTRKVGGVTDGRRTDGYRRPHLEGTLTRTSRCPVIWLAVILVVAWLLGWGVFHVAGGLIHLLLVVALVVFLINFISGRRAV